MALKIGKITIRPDLEKPLYWVHLAVIAIIILSILQIWKGGNMLTISNVLWSIPLLLAGDFIAHTLLGFD